MDPRVNDPAPERFKLYSIDYVLNLPEPPWLIKPLFRVGSIAVMFGPSGTAKTFLALDWALCIALGKPWKGRATRKGAIVYVAGEGGRSLRKRLGAWRQSYGQVVEDAFFILEAPQLLHPEHVETLCQRIQGIEKPLELIVIDTLTRSFVGGDENASKDMGEFFAAVDRLQRVTGATIVVVHHTGKTGKAERGHSSLRNNSDVMIRLSRNKSTIGVTNEKQKDDDEFRDIYLCLTPIELATPSPEGPVWSCVLTETSRSDDQTSGSLSLHLKSTLAALGACPNEPAATKDWVSKAGLPESTFHHHRRALIEGGWVEPAGSRKGFKLTNLGRAALGTATATKVQSTDGSSSPSHPAATATPPLGVAEAAKVVRRGWAGSFLTPRLGDSPS